MTPGSDSDCESPKSISSSERRARLSTSRSLGSSGSRTAAANPSQSADPATSALAAQATRVEEQTHSRSRTAAASTSPDSLSQMSSARTVTSIATESSLRIASSDTYRYATTLHFPERSTQTPARRGALIVNAIAETPADASAQGSSGSGSTSQVPTHDRPAYSYSQSYSQIAYANDASESQSTLQTTSSLRSRSNSSWTMTIAEIPADANPVPVPSTTDPTEPNPRSALAGYGSAAVTTSGLEAGYVPMRTLPIEHGHVQYDSGVYGTASSSGAVAEPDAYRPPSLAQYTLSDATARTTSSHNVASEHGLASSTALWTSSPPGGYAVRQRSAEWVPASSSGRPSFSGYSLFVPQGSSPTHTNSPESVAEPSSTPWVAAARPSTIEAVESSDFQPVGTYEDETPATDVPVRPSLARSAALSSSHSAPSLRITSLSTSGASNVPARTPTSATESTITSFRVPEPLSSRSYASQPQPSASRTTEGLGDSNVPLSRISANYQSVQTTGTRLFAASPSTNSRGHQQAYHSPRRGSESHSPASSRFTYAAPAEQEYRQKGPAITSQDSMVQRSGYGGLIQMESVNETGDGPAPYAGGTSSGPSDFRGANVGLVGTNTSSYLGPYGVGIASDGDPSSSAALSNPLAPPNTVPAATSPSRSCEYPYTPSGPAPVPVPASATASSSGKGGSTSHSTRKRNHPCWMCHKSFDRPSTLRKHLLVHTGEKAYVCDICGRRFGVASNLNRHHRRCISKPVNSASFHSASTSDPGAGPSTSASTLPISGAEVMAREQTNPDVRRSERERSDGREVPEADQQASGLPAAASTSQPPSSRAPRGRRRGRSRDPNPLAGQSFLSGSEASSSHQSPYHLRPAFASGSGEGSSQLAIATASPTAPAGEATGERRPKRRRRAPSPSRWVPESLRNFSLSPVRTRTSTPLPPVSPGYDAATGIWEERDSYATIPDENVDPSGQSGSGGENTNPIRTREERLRNFEYAPYHECGWTGRLPGPAVVGSDVTNYTKSHGGSGSDGRFSGGNGGGDGPLKFMYEFNLAAA